MPRHHHQHHHCLHFQLQYCRVKEFNGDIYIDLRKFYFDGDAAGGSDVEGSSLPGLKPTTKGVMLGLREWHKLKATMGAIEDALEETKEKRRAARR